MIEAICYKVTYQVFALPMDLYFNCQAESPEQARDLWVKSGCKGRIVSVAEVPFDKWTVYAKASDFLD